MNKIIEAIERWIESADLSLSLRVMGGVVILIAVLIYLGFHTPESDEPSPCSPKGFPGRCYALDPDVCEVMWKKSEKTCTALVNSLSLPPGRLANPIVVKCQVAGIDKVFRYNRRDSAECVKMFSDLEDWAKRNDINP
jgi:hypothetical protein